MKFREIVDAFNNPNADAGLVLKVFLGIALLLSALFYFKTSVATAILFILGWGGFAYLLSIGVKLARMDRRDNMMSVASTYVNQADSLEERERRMGLLATAGAAALAAEAMSRSSETPRFNIDGTPMLRGMDVDTLGRAMGNTDDFLTNFDAPSVDVGNGMPLSPDMSYQPPSGMND